MKILIFSWRDIRHPGAGGAEILTLELAKRWVKNGHPVTWISANFPGGKTKEVIDGIQVLRLSRFYHYSPSEYLNYLVKTISFYRKQLCGKYDLILDQVHGLPFFTPLYAKERVILFPLEVAGQIWFREIPFPYSLIGFCLEQLYIQLFKKVPFLTISPSTTKELQKLGIKNISTILPGLVFRSRRHVPYKSPTPLLVSLGRITEMKRIEDTLHAFRLLHKEFPLVKLIILGRGKNKYCQKLEKICKEMKIDDRVFFLGFVSEKRKQEVLSQAWALVSTSLKEGWGLTVIEAAACGTPTVAYRVPGLTDSIKNGKTGILCRKNTTVELAKNIKKILLDDKLRQRLSQNALEYSRAFSWDKAAMEALRLFNTSSKL